MKADILFTNPPFKHINQLLNFIKDFNKDFILWSSLTGIGDFIRYFKSDIYFSEIKMPYKQYITPDGKKRKVGSYIVSSFNVFDKPNI